MARILADENFPLPAVEALRKLGHDVLTLAEAGKSGQAVTDKEVLIMAKEAQRIIVTFNRRHFVQLHNETSDHAGIAVCTVDTNFGALAQRIHETLQSEAEISGKLLRINRPAQ